MELCLGCNAERLTSNQETELGGTATGDFKVRDPGPALKRGVISAKIKVQTGPQPQRTLQAGQTCLVRTRQQSNVLSLLRPHGREQIGEDIFREQAGETTGTTPNDAGGSVRTQVNHRQHFE